MTNHVFCCFSVAMSDFLRPHGLHLIRISCPSQSPKICSNSCSLSQWCHPTFSFSVIPFSCPVFPSIRVFFKNSALPITCPKYWSFSLASVLPTNIQGRFPLELTGLISFQSKELSVSSIAPQFESIISSVFSLLYGPILTSIYRIFICTVSLVIQMVKNLPAMWETWVQSLGWEDPLEEGTATHSSILSMDRGA